MSTADFPGFSGIVNKNTELQRRLHSQLVCARFEETTEIALAFDALGYKVNGAGGDGGSLAMLSIEVASQCGKLRSCPTH